MRSASDVAHRSSHDIVVSLTNRDSPRQIRNLLRRQEEIGRTAAHIVAVDGECQSFTNQGLPAFSLNRAWIEFTHQERIRLYGAQPTLVPGNGDLFFLDVCRQLEPLPFRHLWLIEDDVDWSGNWADFLLRFESFEGDLVGTNLRRHSQSLDWYWWSTFAPPAHIPMSDWLVGFYPTRRVSRRFIELILADDRASWRGHFECAWPTVARAEGLLVRDFAEVDGPSVYENVNEGWMGPGTYVYRPVRSDGYFHEAPFNLQQRDMLYHPIKVA